MLRRHVKRSVHVDKSDGLEEETVFVLVLLPLITGLVTSMRWKDQLWLYLLAVECWYLLSCHRFCTLYTWLKLTDLI